MFDTRSILAGVAALFMMSGAISQTQERSIVRHPVANSSVPVSAAVEVPASASLVYLSGKLPPLKDASQPLDSPLAYGGDTKGQTIAVLAAIESALSDLGLTLGDVVKVQVFLVGDPALGNKMDMKGFTEGYAMFFGTPSQPELPARTLMQVAGLANKAFLVEVDVIAVRRSQ
ncbi:MULTISPECIES: RidA family protein [Pseudomonas]|uniref:RidA family protein n=1 Tax=Pseudomonas TaxID=286 RepID=UPI001BEA920A|nr:MULTISPECIES: RidA family protein [Pseudomonas]MBT2338657.1 RidA family protein [Pseudomonas fluorescens]MCD4528165.1 RidA family protein [Pseudomonas sp. C3-2018]